MRSTSGADGAPPFGAHPGPFGGQVEGPFGGPGPQAYPPFPQQTPFPFEGLSQPTCELDERYFSPGRPLPAPGPARRDVYLGGEGDAGSRFELESPADPPPFRRQPAPTAIATLDDLFADAAPVLAPRRGAIQLMALAVSTITFIGVLAAALAAPVVVPVGVGAREAADFWTQLPTALPIGALPSRSTVLAADGSVIATLFQENRVPVTLDQVHPNMIDALLSIEDARFYDHDGLDYKGIGRAVAARGQGAGGSTITQQYVKNVLLSQAEGSEGRAAATERSVIRKVKEARYALAVEQSLSKDEILEGYLNIAFFGDRAYGVGAAAVRYFGVPASELTVGQSALLAGLVKNPSGLNPTSNPDGAQARRNLVLDRMAATGKITAVQAQEEKAAPLGLNLTTTPNGCAVSAYPTFCEHLQSELATNPAFGKTEQARQARLDQGGMTIQTSLDPRLQQAAQRAVDMAFSPANPVAAAIAVVEPGTGAILALAQSKPYGSGENQTQIVLPTAAAFQPGSTFKPIVMAAALAEGFPVGLTLNSPNRIVPRGCDGPAGGFANAGDSQAGTFDMTTAMWGSVNTYWVQAIALAGVLDTAQVARSLGMTSLPTDPKVLSERSCTLALGAYETSPLQIASVYAALSAHGRACTPTAIAAVTGAAGPEPAPAPNCRQAISPAVADTVSQAMRGVVGKRGTGPRAAIGRPTAGKTGTTNDYGAGWFAGYTPAPGLAAAVWVGDPRGPSHELRNVYGFGQRWPQVFGGGIPALTWKAFMAEAVKGSPAAVFAPAGPSPIVGVGVVVPDVRGLTVPVAALLLQEQGLNSALVGTAGKDARVSVSSPAAGQPVTAGTTVSLTVG